MTIEEKEDVGLWFPEEGLVPGVDYEESTPDNPEWEGMTGAQIVENEFGCIHPDADPSLHWRQNSDGTETRLFCLCYCMECKEY